jgi:hypothetical protein
VPQAPCLPEIVSKESYAVSLEQAQKILVLGASQFNQSSSTHRVQSYLWRDANKAGNLSDFDTVIMNLIGQSGFSVEEVDAIKSVVSIESIWDVVEHNGKVIVAGDSRNFNSAVSWLGFHLIWDNSSGDTVVVQTECPQEYRRYISHVNKWDYSLRGCLKSHP